MKTSPISRDEKGVAHLVLALVVATVLAAVAYAGYRVANRSDDTAGNQSVSKQTPVPSQIKTKADLSQASKALDTLPIDNGVNPDLLTADINAIQ